MIDRDVIKLLLKRGFYFAACNQPDVAIFYKPKSPDTLDVCILSDFTGGYVYLPQQLYAIANEVERKFIFNGYHNISCHFILFTDNLDRARNFTLSGLNFWLVDTVMKRLIIYDNQPSDFYLLREELENTISKPDKKRSSLLSVPFITFILIAINVIVFFFMEMYGSTTDSSFMAKYGAMSWRFLFEDHEYYRLISSMFMHFGGEHIINNMITLAVIGNEVEKITGHLRFLIIYILSGIGAGFISAVYNMNVHPDEYIISAGASGAIFGIIGALLVVSLIYKSVRRTIKPINVAIIIILSIINGFMNFQIDNMAHIGGLMFGIIITFISCLCCKSVIK